MMATSRTEARKTLRVEGRGCVFGSGAVLGYPPKSRSRVSYQGVHKIGGTPRWKAKVDDEYERLMAPIEEEYLRVKAQNEAERKQLLAAALAKYKRKRAEAWKKYFPEAPSREKSK